MNVTDCTPGRSVVYRPHPNAQAEDGVIVRVAIDDLVFVQYRGDAQPKATRAADLEPAS